MTLVVDDRQSTQGRPGLHALIVGVSNYQYLPNPGMDGTQESLGLHKLSCAATSAFKVYRWLQQNQQNFPVPLASVRLLISPTGQEKDRENALNGLADVATLDNFLKEAKAWRDDAGSHAENFTFFYFAGHGAQRTPEDAVLLLQDFGDGLGGRLKNAVDVGNIHNGMAQSYTHPNIAQTQIYFIDACRDFLPAFRNYQPSDTTQVFEVQRTGIDYRVAPIYFAAVPGAKAHAFTDEETIFCRALLDCLSNDAADFREIAGDDKWCVSVHSLTVALELLTDDWSEKIVVGGLVREKIIYYLNRRPMVKIRLEIEPSQALTKTKLEVFDRPSARRGMPLPFPLDPHPYKADWPAGVYTIKALITPPDRRFRNIVYESRIIKPPMYLKTIKVLK